MAKLPDELLLAEESLAAFTVRMFQDSATGNETRAQILRGIQKFLSSQPEPDAAQIAAVSADLAAAEKAAATAASLSSARFKIQPGDRVVSVSVTDAGVAAGAGTRVRLSGKDLVVETQITPDGEAAFALNQAQIEQLSRNFTVEVLDANGKQVATGPSIDLEDDNLVQVQVSLPPPTPEPPPGKKPRPPKK